MSARKLEYGWYRLGPGSAPQAAVGISRLTKKLVPLLAVAKEALLSKIL